MFKLYIYFTTAFVLFQLFFFGIMNSMLKEKSVVLNTEYYKIVSVMVYRTETRKLLTTEWEVFSKYAFAGAYSDAFYDLKTRSEQLLEDEILANISTMKRVNFMCTHDYLVEPLIAYVTGCHSIIRFYENLRWVNYLAGVAMIISADGSVRYIPVRGLDKGSM